MAEIAGDPWAAGTKLGLVSLALVCFLVTPTASSQEDTQESFGETLDVVVVEVAAVVTDADGRRVPALPREDFRLLVDGEEVPIDYFAEVRDGRAVTLASAERGADRAGDLAPGEPAPTNYLVFLDEYFTIGARRDYVVEQIAERVRELPPQDRMAVVAFDGNRIRRLAGWDTPRAELEAVLLAALDRPTYGLLRATEWVRRGRGGPWHDRLAQQFELERVLTAVRSTLRTVPRPEGRKVLLLLGGGWSVRSAVPRWPSGDPIYRALPTGYGPDAEVEDLALILPVIDSANLLGYTVYPVDVNGLRDPGGLREPGDPPFAEELVRLGTLRVLAGETGGRALLFADRQRPLEEVVEDTRSYYSLGFTPELERDGSRHEIRVELRRPGLEVRARRGYRDLSRATELELLAESALRFGGGSAGGGEGTVLAVELGAPERRPRRTMVVPLRLDVPWSRITLVPSGEGLVSRLEIRVAVRDKEGSISDVATVPLQLAREEPPTKEAVLRWESDLTMRRERHDVVVSVYDALSGQVLTRRVSVEP